MLVCKTRSGVFLFVFMFFKLWKSLCHQQGVWKLKFSQYSELEMALPEKILDVGRFNDAAAMSPCDTCQAGLDLCAPSLAPATQDWVNVHRAAPAMQSQPSTRRIAASLHSPPRMRSNFFICTKCCACFAKNGSPAAKCWPCHATQPRTSSSGTQARATNPQEVISPHSRCCNCKQKN